MLHKKDLQILEILAQNCRIAHTTIAAALSVSTDTVGYRVGQLEQSGYLAQYVLFIDCRRLGVTRYHFLMRFESRVKDRAAIIERLTAHPYVMWINTFIGHYDIQVIVDARDGFHLNQIRHELSAAASGQIQDYRILTHLADLEFTQLNPLLNLDTKFEKKADASFSDILSTARFPVALDFKLYSPTRHEITLLELLSKDVRASLSDLARQVGVDRQTVRKHIVRLIKNKVIINFGAIPNLTQLGFVTYYLLVRVSTKTPPAALQRPFQKLRNIFYAGQMMGDFDLILYLNARNPEELNTSIEIFKRELGDYIERFELMVQDKVHYWRQFTKGIEKTLRERIH